MEIYFNVILLYSPVSSDLILFIQGSCKSGVDCAGKAVESETGLLF